MSLIENFKKRGWRDILDPRKWILFFRAKRRQVQGTTIAISKTESLTLTNEELQSFCEQVIYRQSFSECRTCLKEGQCVHCGCKSPELFFDKEMVCSGGNWDEMLSPKEWKIFKQDKGIDLTARYKWQN